MKYQMLVVGGSWPSSELVLSESSGYIRNLVGELRKCMKERWTIVECNGLGKFKYLQGLLDDITKYTCVLWAPDVDNAEGKIIQEIKHKHPTCILIETKRNDNSKYTDKDLVAHMLKNHANLMLELERVLDRVILGRLLDPLGNEWQESTSHINDIALAISRRVNKLLTYTRIPSVKMGEAEEIPQSPKLAEFVCWVKVIANQLHELVHGVNTERFLGNYAFRCLNGFPAVRDGESIYVSPRNVDKRGITTKDFVRVHATVQEHPSFNVFLGYYGDRKPSVDAPIVCGLFNHFPKIKYMLHTHAYVENTEMITNTIIPCGCLEEVDVFFKRFPDDLTFGAINLRGHGSMILMGEDNLCFLQEVKFKARPVPEIAAPYI